MEHISLSSGMQTSIVRGCDYADSYSMTCEGAAQPARQNLSSLGTSFRDPCLLRLLRRCIVLMEKYFLIFPGFCVCGTACHRSERNTWSFETKVISKYAAAFLI